MGLDIEPDAKFHEQIVNDPWRLPAMLLPRLRDHERPRHARDRHVPLVERIHAAGWRVENWSEPPPPRTGRAAAAMRRLLQAVL